MNTNDTLAEARRSFYDRRARWRGVIQQVEALIAAAEYAALYETPSPNEQELFADLARSRREGFEASYLMLAVRKGEDDASDLAAIREATARLATHERCSAALASFSREDAFHAAMVDAGLDTANRLIAPGLLTACKDARPLESALDAIAADVRLREGWQL